MDDGKSWDELFAHQEWVRALAVRLCADAGAADDLVQDTWVEVLRGRERSVSRPWLGGIVRHLWRRRVQRDGARSARELAPTRDESVPSPDELFAQAELQRRVLAAVASLDESYRVVVLLKHYEGLGAEEIAARLRCPSSTVRNRLARAHEQLRAKLDRDYGERASWSVLFVPTFAGAPSAKLAAGVGIAVKTGLAVGAAALAVVAVIFWSRGHSNASMSDELAGATSNAPSAPVEVLANAPAPEPAERANVEADPSAVAPAKKFEHVLVLGQVEGLLAESKAQAELTFFDERCGEHKATLGANDGYSLFGLTPGRYRIVGWCNGCLQLDDELELDGSVERVQHDVTFVRARVLPVKFVERGSGAPYQPKFLDPIGVGLGVVATRERVQHIEGVHGRSPWNVGVGLFRGRSEFAGSPLIPEGASGALELHAELPLYANLVMRSVVLESRLITGNESELVFEVDLAELEKQLGSVTARCVDASNGSPIANASVSLGFTDGGDTRATTDADGRVQIERAAPGLRTFGIWADGFADLSSFVRVEPGRTLDLGTIELLHPARLSGLVFTKDGTPVTAQLAWVSLDRLRSPRDADTRASFETRADGSFELDWLGAERQRLIAVADGWAITALDVDARSGSASGLEFKLERGTEVFVRTRAGFHGGCDVLLFDAAGIPLHYDFVHATFPRAWRLKPGRYELKQIVDDHATRTQVLEVGSEPLTVELDAP